MIFLSQKEHSNIITNLRATNEPLLTVTECLPSNMDQKDDDADNNIGGSVGNIRQRKKVIERNVSAPLPGMLQVRKG